MILWVAEWLKEKLALDCIYTVIFDVQKINVMKK
jgi:hypothetical protein